MEKLKRTRRGPLFLVPKCYNSEMRKIIIVGVVIAVAVASIVAFMKQAVDNKNGIMKIETMTITSPSFAHNGTIPKKYTCDGENVSPELRIEGVPKEAKSLALIMDDPDAPMETWVHWIIWNLTRLEGDPPSAIEIEENVGSFNTLVSGRNNSLVVRKAIEGITSFGKPGYGGPCPPSGTHRYFFRAYALDVALNIPNGAGRGDLERAMEGHILARAELVGFYGR